MSNDEVTKDLIAAIQEAEESCLRDMRVYASFVLTITNDARFEDADWANWEVQTCLKSLEKYRRELDKYCAGIRSNIKKLLKNES